MYETVNGVTLHYEVHGAGEPVLFVHGFPLTGALWEPLLEPLADDYKLIVPDLRGFGGSDARGEGSMGQYAADLAALLDALGEVRPVVLVGFSMGGYILFEFWRRYPERVRALVLADTRAPADSDEGRRGRYATLDKVRAEGSAVVADAMLPKLFAAQASAALKQAWHARMAGAEPQGVAAALRAMAERPDSTETLATIQRPVLIMVGAEDAITPPADAEAMAEAIPGAQLETIAGAGHMAPVEQPVRFVAHLLQFLDELAPAAFPFSK